MLYTFISDYDHLGLVWDSEQITRLVGNRDSGGNMDERIDLWRGPREFKSLYLEPLKVSFPILHKDSKGKKIPDICAVQGRLFLNLKAYEALKPIIGDDGEFLPLTYELGEAYFFNPLRVADDVDGVNQELSRKNEWGDLENLAFHESKVENWSVFRTAFNSYQTLQGNESVKNAVEQAGLNGLYITPELGCIYAVNKNDALNLS